MLRHTPSKLFLTAVFFIPLFGCLDMKELVVNYSLDKDLSGSMEIVYGGIHSDESEEEAQRREMAEFYKDLPEMTEEHAFMWGLLEKEVIFENKSELGCDVVIKGKIESLLRSLAPLMDGGVYRVQRTNDTFSCSVKSSELMVDDMGFVVNITCAGKILSHNAHDFDEQNQVMTWIGSKLGDSGIEFKLQIGT